MTPDWAAPVDSEALRSKGAPPRTSVAMTHRQLANSLREALTIFSSAAQLLPRLTQGHAQALELSTIMNRQIQLLCDQINAMEASDEAN